MTALLYRGNWKSLRPGLDRRAMNRALIIGASGGIGRAVAQELSLRGAEIVTLSRREDGMDVTSASAVQTAMADLSGEFDAIFIAVGTLAAGGRPEKSLGEIDADIMARVMAVNAIGPALILSQVTRLLPQSKRAVVAVLSARVGSIGDNRLGGWHSYRASKAALNQITRGAAIEMGRTRKQAIVVALHPGTVETAFTQGYPGHSKVSPQTCAVNLVDAMQRLTPAHSGGFYDYSGAELPW